jgi:hypothetical protein
MTEASPPPRPADELTKSVVDVVEATFGVGVALAKTAAHMTAGSKGVPDPTRPEPLQAIIHYSLATASNLASALVSAVNAAGRGGETPRPATRAAGGPRVRPGATLRVPLSVENPGERPMTGMAPLVRAVRRDGADCADLPFAAVRFAPAAFEVAPRDFEKLTVFIDVPEAARPGRYDLTLALGPQADDLPMSFEVVAPD